MLYCRNFFVANLRLVLIAVAAVLTASCQPSGPAPEPQRARHDISLTEDGNIIEARVPNSATLESLLRRHDLPAPFTTAMIDAVRAVFNPRDLRANQSYRLTRSLDGLFREFRYQIDADRFLRVVMRGATADAAAPAFDVEVVPLPKEFELDAVVAEISKEHSSLVGSFEAEGENILLPLQLAEIFGGEIDFNSDLQRGDRIEVLFDRAIRHGEFVGYGDVRAAVITNSGKRISAIRFDGDDGKPQWYDEHGRSLKRQFLKSPLPFDPRVTSGFSYHRKHPVLGYTRAHLGVDFGAPTGTPVKAVATGVVEVAGWSGEAGRMVRIRHAGGYETAYLHLSSFGPGIRPGVRVDQGQLIGRVGASGTVTAAHLDYRIIKNGQYVNPIAEHSKMPPGEPLAADVLAAFEAVRDARFGELQQRVAAPAPVATPPSGGRN